MNINMDRINNINNFALKALLLGGVMGPLMIWFYSFKNSHWSIKAVTFVLYSVVELIWFIYLWFIWLPVMIISIILIVWIDIRYGSRLERYQRQLENNRNGDN